MFWKYLYNTYIATEDEGVNRFDTLFKGITFDFVPIDISTIYAGKDALMTYELYQYQYNLDFYTSWTVSLNSIKLLLKK